MRLRKYCLSLPLHDQMVSLSYSRYCADAQFSCISASYAGIVQWYRCSKPFFTKMTISRYSPSKITLCSVFNACLYKTISNIRFYDFTMYCFSFSIRRGSAPTAKRSTATVSTVHRWSTTAIQWVNSLSSKNFLHTILKHIVGL